MHLYHGPTSHFIQDAQQNAISIKLSEAFRAHFRYNPAPSEVASWRNSLRAMALVLRESELLTTNVVVEYQLPLTSRRLDCLVLGRSAEERPSAVIVELKQWEEAGLSNVEGCVETWVGGARREVAHPSAQVAQYREYLEDGHLAFHGQDSIALDACSYLHNASTAETSPLRDKRYAAWLEHAPIYCGDQSMELVEHLRQKTLHGDDGDLLERVVEARYRPSKGLMNHVAQVIEDEPVYTLLDEQFVTFQSILNRVRQAYHTREKAVVIVHGGPGTGKSVLATNLVARLSKQHYTVHHATGSKAFTENLKRCVGSRAAAVFRYFNNFTHAEASELDVLICDEAHRIRSSSNHRFTRKDQRSDKAQIEELIHAARTSVFFIDDMQTVRPGEVGSSDLIRDEAQRQDADLFEHELEAQFRCAGSDGFVNWVDNTLGLRKTANILWNEGEEAFDFRIVDTVEDLDGLIRKRDGQGHTARLVAGYCWPWSNEKDKDGQLVEDVVIGNWRRPWNARPELTRLPTNVPKSMYWATDPGGIDQVGCIYTAQGFEFDYAGVIWGPDLRYDPKTGEWIGDPMASYDGTVKRAKTTFLANVAHVYRVLLSRGLRGCYVYFLDPATRQFVESRIDRVVGGGKEGRVRAPREAPRAAEVPADPYEGLGKTAAAVREAMQGIEALRELAADRELVADIASQLEREDYSGWEGDDQVRSRVERSVARILGSLEVSHDSRDEFARDLLTSLAAD